MTLLYCTANYAACSKQVPGMVIDRNFDPDDAKKLREIRFAARWLFEVSKQSFSKTVGERPTAWGRL